MAAPAQLGTSSSSSSSSVPSLPPPRPKSPPAYPDLYGKRRETAKVQMLEREIGFLEEELRSAQSLQPASRCCKEITDYVVANSDPFIPTNRKIRRPCRFWKWLCGMPCFNLSWICCCCCTGCSIHLERPRCSCCSCDCNPCNGGGVALVPVQIAVEKSHAEETVAISHLLHALIALAAYADAHVLNVQRYALVAVVQTSVVTLAIYVSSIFKHFHL
ncbi:hypothetical protein CMV_015916 [Castanea mollissima]|uniref:G protein gamma domain-containing protein n=1 Tax=Castanea mollissima TaxID=60419 RepID=A0A8J4R8U3_9ROSI|nr:hypothetical protein CMV_015916 [Castanea mollissima]